MWSDLLHFSELWRPKLNSLIRGGGGGGDGGDAIHWTPGAGDPRYCLGLVTIKARDIIVAVSNIYKLL